MRSICGSRWTCYTSRNKILRRFSSPQNNPHQPTRKCSHLFDTQPTSQDTPKLQVVTHTHHSTPHDQKQTHDKIPHHRHIVKSHTERMMGKAIALALGAMLMVSPSAHASGDGSVQVSGFRVGIYISPCCGLNAGCRSKKIDLRWGARHSSLVDLVTGASDNSVTMTESHASNPRSHRFAVD